MELKSTRGTGKCRPNEFVAFDNSKVDRKTYFVRFVDDILTAVTSDKKWKSYKHFIPTTNAFT